MGCSQRPVDPTDRTRAVEWVVRRIVPALFDGWGAVNAAGIRAALDALLGPGADPQEASWLFENTMRFAQALRAALS